MVVSGKLKKYIGAIEDEEAAGLLYDKYSIILQGLKVSSLNHAFLSIQLLNGVTSKTRLDMPKHLIKLFMRAFLQAKTNHSYTKQSILKLLRTQDEEILKSTGVTNEQEHKCAQKFNQDACEIKIYASYDDMSN